MASAKAPVDWSSRMEGQNNGGRDGELRFIAVISPPLSESSSSKPHQNGGLEDVASQNLSLGGCDTALMLDVGFGGAVKVLERPDMANISIVLAVNGTTMSLGYRISNLGSLQARSMAAAIGRIISTLIDRPLTPLRDFEMCDDKDMSIFREWNNVETTWAEQCVHDLFSKQVAGNADNMAVDAWDGQFTYRELDRLSSNLAEHLIDLGVLPETFVALCFEKSKWLVVSILAVIKAGGAYVVIEPYYPLARMTDICTQLEIDIMLASQDLLHIANKLSNQVVAVEPGSEYFRQSQSAREQRKRQSPSTPRNALYVVFSSGSTGKPKGIVVEHAAFVSWGITLRQSLGLGAHSRVLQFSSFAFLIAHRDVLLTLMFGGCVCMPSESQRLNHLETFITEYHVNWANLTPSVAALLNPDMATGLQTLLLTSEPMSLSSLTTWDGKVNLLFAYGQAESVSLCCVNTSPTAGSDRKNVGHRVGRSVWLVDPDNHNKLVPMGAVGELIIQGPILARGYLDSERTALAFLHDTPWLQKLQPGYSGRLYKTGDLAQFADDGSVRYICRKDNSVKLYGQRLDLDEVVHHIETCLTEMSDTAVFNVVVDLFHVPHSNDIKLTAFLGFDSISPDTSNPLLLGPLDRASVYLREFRSRLADVIPRYMIPALVVPVSRIPLNLSGKTDRRQLGEILSLMTVVELASCMESNVSHEAPHTAQELKLRTLWSQVLNTAESSIGRLDDFFRRGGDSLAAMKLVSIAHAAGFALSFSDIFAHPRLSSQADLLDSAPRHTQDNYYCAPFALITESRKQIILAAAAEKYGLSDSQVEDIYPTTPMQEGLIALNDLRPGSYVSQRVYKIANDVSLCNLETAWKSTMDANPPLRTRLVRCSDNGSTYQLIVRNQMAFDINDNLNDYLNISRLGDDAAKACKFQSLLVIQQNQSLSEEKCDIFSATESLIVRPTWDTYALSILCSPAIDGKIQFEAVYDAAVVPKAQARRILQVFANVLKQTVTSPDIVVADIVGISTEDVEQIQAWNNSVSPTVTECIHDMIHGHVVSQPESTAIDAWDGRLTYKELDEQSSLLSGILVGHGLRQEVFVPLCLEKSKWVAVAILAVVKAGGAFILLDPSHPTERLAWICDGSLEFVGRKDNQVKLHGQRMELAEIEHHVAQSFPMATDSIVEIITPLGSTDQKILAAFIWDATSTAGKHSVQSLSTLHEPNLFAGQSEAFRLKVSLAEAELRKSLPRFMIPSLWIPLAQFPLSRNGKADRRLIKGQACLLSRQELGIYQRIGSSNKRTPSTESEGRIHQLVADVLGLSARDVGMNDNFFQLGGDSIKAMIMSTRAIDMDLRLAAADILAYPRLCDMAEVASHASANKTCYFEQHPPPPPFSLLPTEHNHDELLQEISEQCGIDKDSIEDVYPCTPLQEGLFALTIKQPTAYVLKFTLQLTQDLDVDRFQDAWDTIIAANPILRTRIVCATSIGGSLVQAVMSKASYKQPIDTTGQYAVGLGKSLFSIQLLPRDKDLERYKAVVTIHHALYDGVSLGLILKQLSAAYYQRQETITPPYKCFIQYCLSQPADDEVGRFWKAELEDAAGSVFTTAPMDSYFLHSPLHAVSRVSLPSDAQANVPLSAALKLAWGIVVSSFTGESDAVFGTVVSGRMANVKGIDKMAGPTIATVPFRIRHVPSMTIQQALDQVQSRSLEMIRFEQTGLQRIRQLGFADACQFQSLLIVQFAEEEDFPASPLYKLVQGTPADTFHTYPLTIECSPSGGSVHLRATFDSDVVPAKLVDRLLAQYSLALMHITAKPWEPLSSIPLQSTEDATQVWAWNEIVPRRESTCVHEIISGNLAKRRGDPAVCASDGELTYEELEDKSARLANHLTSLGVGPGKMVPLCFEKSKWAIVATLAVLKAGGAFVPLDVSQAAGRRETILACVRAEVVLASAKYATTLATTDRVVFAVHDASLKDLSLPVASALTTPALDGLDSSAAYVFFTSGSTGKPKGVVVDHGALSTSCLSHGSKMGFNEKTRALQFTSYTFDISLMEIFTTLLYGGCICIPSDADRFNNLELSASSMMVNTVSLTASVARLLEPGRIHSLETIIFVGEDATDDDFKKWRHLPQIFNAYGPTECTIFCSINKVQVNSNASSNIGKAVGSVTLVDKVDYTRRATCEMISVDDNFYDIGGDSIRIISLMRLIQNEFHVRLGLSSVNSRNTTISKIADYVDNRFEVGSTFDLEGEVGDTLSLNWAAATCQPWFNPAKSVHAPAIVFLTGGTGFLGTQILRRLLISNVVKRVVALVRAPSAAQGLERLKHTAVTAGWWKAEHEARIEAWIGDLELSQLGLSGSQWARLSGTSTGDNVTAVIHNGAVVNWHMDYDSLRSANVLATIELLKAATLSRSSPRFVFVSGGVMADLETSPGNTTVAEQLSRSNGYAQSKFVAETIVRRFVSQLPSSQNRFSVIKPGMIIGTADKGVANVDDFIWRVVATASRLQLFPSDAEESWMPISDAGFVASQTVAQVLTDDISPYVNVATTFGLGSSDFWEQVNAELNHACEPVPWSVWVERALEDTNRGGEDHPLWPVQDVLRGRHSSSISVSSPLSPPDKEVLCSAVRANLLLNNGAQLPGSCNSDAPPDATTMIVSQHYQRR
ncbi:hypothetical protein MY11210_006513 [Beauveria gryllotalpidicola]